MPANRGIRLDIPEDRRVGQRTAGLVARQDGREIEAKAVDMHLGDPITQAILDQPAHDRLIGVQCVAAAGVISVTRFVLLEDVVKVIGEAAITQRRPIMAAFRGVIEDHIEDDFDFRHGGAP